MKRPVLGLAAAFIYCAVDLSLLIMTLVVVHNGATMMIRNIMEILQDGAENLLALCPLWTIPTVDSLMDFADMGWGALVICSMTVTMFGLADISFVCGIACSCCPYTPTRAAHGLALGSLFFFGTALLFCNPGFALHWKNDGNPFFGATSPRAIDSRYYETSCSGGYGGGCSGSYVGTVVAEHDTWCPTGTSPLVESANTLAVVSLILFGTTWLLLLVGLLVACILNKGLCFRLCVALPAMIAALYGLVIGGIQAPLVLPWIFAHAIWQYTRLLVNCIAGIDQAALDQDFRVKSNDDVVPGVIGAVTASGDIDDYGGGAVDAGGYMGY